MPVAIPFEWREDAETLIFVLLIKGVKAKNLDIFLSEHYIKVNCHPNLFEADLLHSIDYGHPKTLCRVSSGKVTLTLKKAESGLWTNFRAKGTKEEIKEQRRKSIADANERNTELDKKKDDFKHEMIKAGEHEQWRLDRENREQIEKWQNEEKRLAEEEVYAAFDKETKAALTDQAPPRSAEDIDERPWEKIGAVPADEEKPSSGGLDEMDDEITLAQTARESNTEAKITEVTDQEADEIRERKTKTNVVKLGSSKASDALAAKHEASKGAIFEDPPAEPDLLPEVRENPGKVALRMSKSYRAGVPMRESAVKRQPPHPKNITAQPNKALVGDERDEDENDPVWLKDKADCLMVVGDYQGAYNAYTRALTIAANARAFANRAVAALYMGNFEQCVEDCTRGLSVLSMRYRVPDGHCPPPKDPEDLQVEAKLEVRMGTAYLWMGAFGKAEQHFQKALDVEDGLPDHEERLTVKEDLARIKQAKEAHLLKEKADLATRRGKQESYLDAVEMYREASTAAPESAVVFANSCFAKLQVSALEECVKDADIALESLTRWPSAKKQPKPPARPQRLQPPYLDDPTFKHPDEAAKDEVDWLMKHSGGNVSDLPSLPPEYEWVRDAAEKNNDNAWIAVKKKMSKATQDAIRRSTQTLQDTLYTRNVRQILDNVVHAKELNKHGEGPSAKAIHQAEEYAQQLSDHLEERDKERMEEEELERQMLENYDLEKALAGTGSTTGFGRTHPVEKARKRLFVKVKLRRARALELMGDATAAQAELVSVLKVEPANAEAKQRLASLAPGTELPASDPPATASDAAPAELASAVSQAETKEAFTPPPRTSPGEANGVKDSAANGKVCGKEITMDTDDGEDEVPADGGLAQISGLMGSAQEYMKRQDYESALKVYSYTRTKLNQMKDKSALTELKCLSNASLCLQKLRGRLPDLVATCTETIRRINQIRRAGGGDASEEMLVRMECASLSRRGGAYAQLKKFEESEDDAARVKELLADLEK